MHKQCDYPLSQRKMLKLVLALGLLIAAANGHVISKLRREFPSRIVGGHEVDIKDFPYQVSFEFGGRHICGASIFSENFAITAAHCVQGANPSDVRIRAGSTTRENGGSLHPVDSIKYPKEFSGLNMDSDVAVIRVSTPFELGKPGVNRIALATTEPTSGIATVSGWGVLKEGNSNLPVTLQAVDVPIVDRVTCSEELAESGAGITDTMICGGEKGKDSCQGDSGGPFVVGGKLAGIVSWGIGCGRDKYPGVYTNVAHKIITDFIKENTSF